MTMGMYDSVWFKGANGEDVEIQFKHGERVCNNYELGQNIPLPDGLHFGFEGCFVVNNNKVVAVFDSERKFIFDKWGNLLPYPDINSNHPFNNLLSK